MRIFTWFSRRWSFWAVFLLGLTPLIWYQRGLIIAGGDNYFLLNPLALLPEFLQTWSGRFNFGMPNIQTYNLFPFLSFWVLLTKLGLSLLAVEIIWSVSVFELTGLSIYFLYRSLRGVKGESQDNATQWGALVAAVLYMFNVWVMIDPITPVMRLTAAFLPLFVLLWIKGLESEEFSWRYPLLLGFLSLFIVSAYAHPAAAVAIPTAFLLHLLVYLGHTRQFFRAARFSLLTGVFYLVFNLWWLGPYLASSLDIYRAIAGWSQTYQFLKTTSVVEAFRFMGFWAFRSFDEVKKIPHIPYAPLYYEPFFLFLGYALSVFSLAALFFKPRDKRVVFFTLLGLTGIFLAKGSNPPLGSLYQFLYQHFPGFSVFREPFARFTGISVFSFSFLLGVSVSHLYTLFWGRWGQRLGAAGQVFWRAWPSLVLGIILLLAFPMLTGQVIQDYSWHRQTFDDLHVSVPAYWSELNNWLKANDPRARILILPRQPYGSCYHWESGTCSSGRIATILLANPLIFYPEDGYYVGDPLLQDFYDLIMSLEKVGDLTPVFDFLGIDYVLAQNDYFWEGGDPRRHPEFVKSFLSGQKNLLLKRTFGRLDLYEYRRRDFWERLGAPGSYEILGSDERILPQKLLLLEGDPAAPFSFFTRQKYLPSEALLEEARTIFIDPDREEAGPGRRSFSFSVPQDGFYEFYGKGNSFVRDFLSETVSRLDGNVVGLKERPTPIPFWQGMGEFFLGKGPHLFEMTYPSLPVLSPEGFFHGRYVKTEDAEVFSLTGERGFWDIRAGPNSLVDFVPFSSVAPGASYRISFWYKPVKGGPSSAGVHRSNCQMPVTKAQFDSRNLFKEGCENVIFTFPLDLSVSWHRLETVFEAGQDSRTAFLFFKFDKPEQAIQISSPKVEMIVNLTMTLKGRGLEAGKPRSPTDLTYRRESPTKYRVFVRGTPPYELVLRESFNRNWKVYPPGNFFPTPLPESRHFLINGFANGWEIRRGDLKSEEEEQELVIEYQAERIYFLGLLVLGMGIFFGLFYLIYPSVAFRIDRGRHN